MLSARDIREFRGFLRNATDRQVQGIYDKEKRAGREDYAELAIAEAERRGIELERSYHSTKKRSAQLDREIAEALARHTTTGGSFLGMIHAGDRVTIVDRFGTQRSGRAVMRGPHGWVLNMGGKHGTPAIATDENIVSVKSHGLKGLVAKKSTAHATKRSIPGVSKWNTYAGGTSAAEGKHSYDLYVPEGQYTISPYTRRGGRHAGYLLKFAATGGKFPRGSHTGLWHDLGSHSSPQKAASEAAKHYAKGFD